MRTPIAASLVLAASVVAAGSAPPPSLVMATTIVGGIDNAHIVPAAHADATLELLLNVPQRMLYRLDATRVTHALSIAVGRPSWPTPIGPFRILSKEEHPTWDVPVSIQEEMRRAGRRVVTRVPSGPNNPLGDYWLGTSLPGVGIHGTIEPSSISRFVSHGCIRLHPADIATLFPTVREGAVGLLVYEPILMARTSDGIFVEAHPDAYRRLRASPLALLQATAAREGISAAIDWEAVTLVLSKRAGTATRVNAR